uniref:Uncharacterized protein n=1 Tax=Zea mays TaxID=4577 RepID=B6SR06_MAIZE|nr:hypothetical protein [Zea mays]
MTDGREESTCCSGDPSEVKRCCCCTCLCLVARARRPRFLLRPLPARVVLVHVPLLD